RRQSIILTLGPTVLDCHVSALDISRFTEDLAERAQTICNHRVGRYAAAEETNNWHSHLLRTRRERPRRRHAAGKCDELAPPHRRPSDRRWHSSIPLGVHAVLCTTATSGAECPLCAKSGGFAVIDIHDANLKRLAACNRISDHNRQSVRVCPISVGPAKMLLGSLSAPAARGFLPAP